MEGRMRGSAAQWEKEARQMAWPWAVVTGAGLLVLARPWFSNVSVIPGSGGVWSEMVKWILPLGTFFGTAILATLPVGSEFQYRTVAMHLAQPIDRAEVWRQKFLVTLAAVLPPAVIYCIAVSREEGRAVALATAAWILVTTFGAIPFTILARSIIGGIVITQAAAFWLMLFWIYYEKHRNLPTALASLMVIGMVTYAGGMVWWGRRMLVRYQSTEGMQAKEDFVPGAQLVPAAVARWFECRPKQPIANLWRREVRVIRILWLMIAVYLLGWVFMVAFHQLPGARPREERYVVFAATIIVGLIIAVLAGTLSLGEEKTWGTHDWHMTMPVSVTTQWAVKLLFAVGTSVVFVALVPVAIVSLGRWAGLAVGKEFSSHFALILMLDAAIVTFAAFWCACVVKGTIQSTLWVFPVCFMIMMGAQAGSWVLESFGTSLRNGVRELVTWLDPFTVGPALGRLFQVIEFKQLISLVAAPLIAIALIQSLRMFRAQTGANKLRVVRCALPLVLVTFLYGAASVVFFEVLQETWRQARTVMLETDKAIGAWQVSNASNWQARQTNENDLAKVASLSNDTKLWLRSASVTVATAPERIKTGPGPYLPGRVLLILQGAELKDRVPYTAVVRNARGRDCSMMLQIQKGPTEKLDVGYLTVICE